MQGWALVENTSDDDWKDIQLSLVSGRPVSFIQDLYQPLYIPRPVVGPDVVASAYPQTHGGDLDAGRKPQVALEQRLDSMPKIYGGAMRGDRSNRAGRKLSDKDAGAAGAARATRP